MRFKSTSLVRMIDGIYFQYERPKIIDPRQMAIEIQFFKMTRSGFIRNQSRILLVNNGFNILKTLDISHFGKILFFTVQKKSGNYKITELPSQNPSENQWRYNCSIAFHDEFRRVDIQFSPSNFFVRNRSRITSVTGCAIRNLAEIRPERNIFHFHVLIQHRHNAYR